MSSSSSLRRWFTSFLNRIDGKTPPSTVTTPTVPSTPKLQINCLPNNIFITCTRSIPSHTLLFKLSSGLVGAKNAAKTAPKTAMALIDAVKSKLEKMGVDRVSVDFRGITTARGVLISQLKKVGLGITEVSDSTPIPFNGCRPKKSRRL